MVLRALNDMWIALRKFDDQALGFAGRAVLIYAVLVIAVNIIQRIRKKEHKNIWQMAMSICLFGVLCVYLSYLMSLTLSGREPGSRTNKVNLEILGTWRSDGTLSQHAAENVLLFIPFGILVPLTTRFFKKWWNLVLIAFISSMLIETTQLITGRGYFEIDDILLNTGGAVIGYIAFWTVYHSYIAFKHETQLPLSRNEQRLNRVSLFIVQLLPIVLMVMLIFGLGSDNADKSGALSAFVTEKMLYIVNKLMRFGWTAEKIEKTVPLYEGYVRKGAHFTEFAVLTMFTFVFLYCRRMKNSWSFLLAFVLSFLFSAGLAVADEINQGFVDGRNRSIKDVGIDCLGSLTMLIIILIILSLIRYYNVNSKIKKGLDVFR